MTDICFLIALSRSKFSQSEAFGTQLEPYYKYRATESTGCSFDARNILVYLVLYTADNQISKVDPIHKIKSKVLIRLLLGIHVIVSVNNHINDVQTL